MVNSKFNQIDLLVESSKCEAIHILVLKLFRWRFHRIASNNHPFLCDHSNPETQKKRQLVDTMLITVFTTMICECRDFVIMVATEEKKNSPTNSAVPLPEESADKKIKFNKRDIWI